MEARRIGLFLAAMLALAALVVCDAEAQRAGGRRPGTRGQGMRRGTSRGPQARRGPGPTQRGFGQWGYHLDKETSLSGVVVESPGKGVGAGLESHMVVRTAAGEIRRVQLAPPWYLEHLGLEPEPGEAVTVVASPWEAEGQAALMARQVRWRGATYDLRSTGGAPQWAGARYRGYMRYSNLWDPNRIESVTGEIEALSSIRPGGPDMGQGVALRLRVREQEHARVHLGPSWFVDEELPDLKVGEEVTVMGSPVQLPQGEVLLAQEVQRGEHRVAVRARNGRPAWVGGWQNWDGWGPGSRYTRLYDPGTMRTVTGQVEATESASPLETMGQGLTITVRTQEREEVRAHVGPLWFMEQADAVVRPGDEVTLTGSMVEIRNRRVMMVQELQFGDRKLRLRQSDGMPTWTRHGPGRSGGRRGEGATPERGRGPGRGQRGRGAGGGGGGG
jgi:hypothetical protein